MNDSPAVTERPDKIQRDIQRDRRFGKFLQPEILLPGDPPLIGSTVLPGGIVFIVQSHLGQGSVLVERDEVADQKPYRRAICNEMVHVYHEIVFFRSRLYQSGPEQWGLLQAKRPYKALDEGIGLFLLGRVIFQFDAGFRGDHMRRPVVHHGERGSQGLMTIPQSLESNFHPGDIQRSFHLYYLGYIENKG